MISKINWKNSIRLGNAMPMKRPRPPPMLLRKVNPSVLGIWVIFRILISLKEKLNSVQLYIFEVVTRGVIFSVKQLSKGHCCRQPSENSFLKSSYRFSFTSHCFRPSTANNLNGNVQLYLFPILLKIQASMQFDWW